MVNVNFYKRYFLIVTLFVFIILLNKFSLKHFVENSIYFFTARTNRLQDNAGFIVRLGRTLLNLNQTGEENAAIKNENLSLLSKLTRLESLEKENQLLRGQLRQSKEAGQELMTAKVFNISRTGTVSFLLIDRGSRDGVKKSMPVISAGNVVAGLVEEVYDRSSRVLLLDDPRVIISVKVGATAVLGSTRANAHKDSNSEVEIDLITNKDPVEVGDLVITSGLDKFPSSLIVGEISRSELKGGNLFKSVTANLYYNPVSSPLLFLIIN